MTGPLLGEAYKSAGLRNNARWAAKGLPRNSLWTGREFATSGSNLAGAGVPDGFTAQFPQYSDLTPGGTYTYSNPAATTAANTGQTTIFRAFTPANFRVNLGRLTNNIPANSQAHHVFPQKFQADFNARGIDIHDPKFGAWWGSTDHLQNARAYNKAWETFFQTNPTQFQTLQFGRQLMGQYGIQVNF